MRTGKVPSTIGRTMTKTNERIPYLDVARSIAVLWIVGYWHLRVYCGEDHIISFPGDEWITIVVLGLFMFISGILISKYTFDHFKTDCISFYKKRLTRFYLLYAISIILLYLIGYNSLFGRFSLLTSLSMTSTYLPPQHRTLWFFSMIGSFYVFTPFILKKTPSSLLYSFIIIYGGSVLISFFSPRGIDSRFFWCFPMYFAGLCVGRKKNILNKQISKHYWGLLFLAISILQITLIIKHPNKFAYLEYITMPFGILFILYISRLMSHPLIIKVTSLIAYSSMSAYLFHREIYILLFDTYNSLHFNYPYWFSVVTFLPICFVACHFIQKLYDKSISSSNHSS